MTRSAVEAAWMRAAWVLLGSMTVFAQTDPPPSAFEVASVKPSKPDARGSSTNFSQGGGLTIENGTVRQTIATAYDVRDFQIAGAPGWIDSAHYDIFAKSAPGDPRIDGVTNQERAQETRRRLATLLAERFQLKAHRETKEMPVFALVVAKNGVKLTEAAPAPANASGGISTNCGKMKGTRTAMATLAVVLSRQLSHPVLDRTNLAGKYDFQMDWTPDTGPCSAPGEGAATATADSADHPSIFAAIQEQLGLKLESTRAPVEIIVIDHVEKAAEN